jgi:hypothetical protein
VKKLVEVELVITEEDAKMFCTNRFRNLFRLVPSEYVTSTVGDRSDPRDAIVVVAKVVVPVTVRVPPTD